MRSTTHRLTHHDTDPQVLADRLNTGWIMIDRETDPARKDQLEEHWLRLLHSYEDACDRAATTTSERGAA